MKNKASIAAISALAITVAGTAFAWEPGDFGGVSDNWANSPHLARNLEHPTGTWQGLKDLGLLEQFPATTILDNPDIARTEDGFPDIFGEWDFEWSRIGPQQADEDRHIPAEDNYRLMPEDFVSEAKYQEWQDRSLADIPTNNCVPHHAPRIALRTSNLEIVRTGPSATIDKVIFLHEQFNVIRKAYVSYHPEPDMAARPTWGTTTGEWIDRSGDGKPDTFVAVTRGMQGNWVDQTGVVYETGAVLTEEWWLNPDGVMVQHWILEDPKTYAHPMHHVQYFKRYDKEADAVFDEYVCNLESARVELVMQRYQNPASGAAETPAPASSGNGN